MHRNTDGLRWEIRMVRKSDISRLSEAEIAQAAMELEQNRGIPVKQSWGAFLLAIVEAFCVFVVTAAKAGIALGAISATAAGSAALFVHRDSLRIPALLLAIAGALFNLFLLWRFHTLRNAPAAAWRKRPLTRGQRWRIGLVLALSLITLLTAGAEIYFHRVLHHTRI